MGKNQRRLLVAGLMASCALTARRCAAQEPVPLGEPTARTAEAFTRVFDVAELDDGRLLLTDIGETTLAIVDLETGRVERLGRRGQGPGEFRGVFSILRRPDGFHVYDPQNQRFLVVTRDGEIAGTRRFVRPGFSGLAPPHGPDAGRGVYFALRTVGPNGLHRPAVVYRWDTESGDADSVGVVMQYEVGQEGSGITPMPRADAWSVLADGSFLRVVASDYHAEWSGGREGAASGGPIDHPHIPVDGARRDAWIIGMLSSRTGGSARMTGGGRGRPSENDVRRYRSELSPDRFPDLVPPFPGGYVPAAPWGRVWLRLDVASDESRTVFDIIDRRGHRVGRVSVDGRARLVGFGPTSVYVVRKDDFDLEWLERYPRPR